jgi:hypothetical protein
MTFGQAATRHRFKCAKWIFRGQISGNDSGGQSRFAESRIYVDPHAVQTEYIGFRLLKDLFWGVRLKDSKVRGASP